MPAHVVRYTRRHPFLVGFLLLAVWCLVLSYVSVHLDRADARRYRQGRAATIAAANQQICRAINARVLRPVRQLQATNSKGSTRLLVALGFGPAQVRAYKRAQAQAVVALDRRLADIDCRALATNSSTFVQPPPKPPPLPSTTGSGG